ncbi:hypothetical protein Tco_0915689 [Tanacetum coccineum]
MGTSTTRVILFGTLPTTIPSTVPIVDSPTIPPIATTIQYTSPFVCTDSSDNDTSERPPSQDPYEVIVAQWRSRPNEVLKMLTARKRVEPLPTHRLALRYLADYSSSDHFTSDDSSRDSPSDSSLETSLDSHSDTSSDSPSRHSSLSHSILDFPCDSPTATSTGPSHKRRRSPTSSVHVASLVPGALSPVRANLLSPRKRIRDSDSVTDFEVSFEEDFVPHVPREIGLGVDVEDSYEPYTEPDIDPDVQADIDAYIMFVDDIAARGADARVEVGTAAKEEAEEDHPGLVRVDGSLEVMQRGHRIMATSQQSASMSEMISTLEPDNMRLRGMLGVERQRVDRLRRSMSYVQRDLRQIREF